MKRRRLGFLGGVLLLGVSASGCSTVNSASESEISVPAKVTTALEARDALLSLKIFDSCSDPFEVESGARVMGKGLDCTVDDEGFTDNAERRVYGYFSAAVGSGEGWRHPRVLICTAPFDDLSAFKPWMKVVTDDKTFVSWGWLHNNANGYWPEELDPEDIQRVLGGEVVTVQQICDL